MPISARAVIRNRIPCIRPCRHVAATCRHAVDPFRAAAPPIREPPVYTDNVSTHRELTYPYGTACRKNRLSGGSPQRTAPASDAGIRRPSGDSPRPSASFRPLRSTSARDSVTRCRIFRRRPPPRSYRQSDGTFPGFATSPTRIPHPYKAQHFRNRLRRKSSKRRLHFSRTISASSTPSPSLLIRHSRRIVAAARPFGPALAAALRCGGRLSAPSSRAAPHPVSQATAPSVLEPRLSGTSDPAQMFCAGSDEYTTSSPSSRRGSDPPKPSRGTGYG